MLNLKGFDEPQKCYVASDLKDGQIGIIIEGDYRGRVVQRYGKSIVSLGMKHGNGFSQVCTIAIRVLEEGEMLQVGDNS